MGRAGRAKPKNLGGKLKAIRELLGIETYEEMIRRLDCPEIPLYRANIRRYETGENEPPLPILLRYAKLAGISTDILIDDEVDLADALPFKENRFN